MRLASWLASVTLCALAAGCGGGGGGSTGGGGSGGSGTGGSSSGGYSVSVVPTSLQFSTIIGPSAALTQQATATFVGDGLVIGYAPGVQQPTWLNVSVVGSPTSSPVQVQFTISAATYTIAQTLTTSVRFISGKADGSKVVTQDVPVTFTIRDPFRLDTSKVELDSTVGAPSNSRGITVLGQNITWTATSDQPWVHVSPSSASSASSVTIGTDTTGLATGTHTATVHFSDSQSGTVVDLPVSLYVSDNRWNVSRTGVMLLEFGDLAPPTRTVQITNDAGVTAAWTATADVPWLDFTGTGANGDRLSVRANAGVGSLAVDTVNIGTVTITGAGLQQDKLRVGYYRSSQAAPASLTVNMGGGTGEALAVDPVRPYAYVSISDDHFIRVNTASGAVDSILTTPGTQLRYPVVSADGRFLYASDNHLPGGYHVYDLDAAQATAVWPRTTLCCGGGASWVRTRGVPALVDVNLEVVNAETGVYSPPVIPTVDFPKNAFMSASGNGKAVYAYYFGTTNCEPANRYELSSRPATGQLFLGNPRTLTANAPSNPGACLSVDSLVTSFDDSVQYFVGLQGSSYSALLRLNGNNLTEVSVAPYDPHLSMGDSGVKVVSIHGPSAWQVRPFKADDTVAGPDIGNFFFIRDLALSNDERFALIVESTNFDVYRMP